MARSANDNDQSPASDPKPETGTAFQELPFAGQLLVWGMRHWVTALKSGQDFATLTCDGFARFGLGRVGATLDDLFQIIAVSAARQIDIRCVKCRQVSEDEVLLLEGIGAAQKGELPLAYAGLLEILPPAAARHAMPSLISLAKLTAHEGLLLTAVSPGASQGAAMTRLATRRLDRLAQQLEHLSVPALVH